MLRSDVSMFGRLLITCCFVSISVNPSLVFAQEDTATAQARARWHEGVAAFEAGDFELARAAFAQAYALKPTPPVLRNLGEAEVASGHYVSGANHLARFLREADELAPEERHKVKRSIAKAEAHVGRLELTTDVEGAQVFVEGEPVGFTPLEYVVYLEPGWREVRLSKEGRAVQRLVEAEVGRVTPLALPFATDDPKGASGAAPAVSVTAEDGGSSFKVPVLVSGGVMALAGLGVGGYFFFRANSLAEEAQSLRTQVGASGGTCLGNSEPRCAELRDTVDAGFTAERVAVGGFVTGGALAIGTALAWWLWPESRAESTPRLPPTSLRAAPFYDPSSGATLWGGVCSGSF